MHIAHIALQGCLRWHDVEYGVMPDTGGHIRYLLELVEAIHATDPRVRTTILTRRIVDPEVAEDYAKPVEVVDERIRIVRLDGHRLCYLPKEELADELDALRIAGREWCRTEEPPDVWHGHYADAGSLATDLAEDMGGVSLFTGHSLGRVKLSLGASLASLERRIDLEERAIARADAVITSSRDELEHQYGLYREEPRAAYIMPPGTDLAPPEADTIHAVERELQRFLRRPEKPTVLAIARPVARKNLLGLVEAFGASDLRERANLVIVAGNRSRMEDCSGESRAQLEALLAAVDAWDLYGSVALPKHHTPEQIPAYYAYARARRGVFVNIAHHEPFGLTLLEAAAAGLPVVATCHGGPRDIVARTGHGLLVEPMDRDQVVAAIRELVSEPQRWTHFARRAAEGARAFSWTEHARRYLDLVRSLAGHRVGIAAGGAR